MLTLNDLQIPILAPDGNCSAAYLAVYDSASQMEGKLLGKFCGDMSSVANPVMNSTNGVLFLRFKADGLRSGRGFNASFSALCSKTILIRDEDPYQVLTSPNYPHVMQRQYDCYYILKAANPSSTIAVQMTNVQIPTYKHQQVGNECKRHHINFYNGEAAVADKLLHHYCLNEIVPPIISSGSSMFIASLYTVFRLMVSSVNGFCGGDFNALAGVVSSPGYPNSYTTNIECIWVLKASPGNRYELEMMDFDLEASDYCNGDYVEIRQGSSSGALFGGRRLCGSKDSLPSLDSLFIGDIWIKLRTDEATVAKGFMLRFKTATNVVLSGETGQITSPGFPNGIYALNQSFTYSIVVEPNQYVKIAFETLVLDGGYSDYGCRQKLSIFDGLLDTTQLDASSVEQSSYRHLPRPKLRLCSTTHPPPFASEGNAATVVFSATQNNFLQAKFSFKWSMINRSELAQQFDEHLEGVPANVNSTFNLFAGQLGQSVSLTDGNYSQWTGARSDVNFYLSTHSWLHWNLSWSGLSFPHSDGCWENHIFVYLWNGNKFQKAKTICSGNSIRPLELPGSNLVRLHIQYNQILSLTPQQQLDSVPHYNLTLVPVCGGNFTEPSATINSEEVAGRPSLSGATTCRWLVRVRQGKTIEFTVVYYFIGVCSTQLGESLKIFNGDSERSPLLAPPLCHNSNMTSFKLPQTAGNVAFLVFKAATDKDKFRLSYREVGIECGGELVLHSLTDAVSVTSPGYPNRPVLHELICDFVVRGPLNAGLQVTFAQERWEMCQPNQTYLEIYEGGTDLAPLLKTLCLPTDYEDAVLISSHVTLLRYVVRSLPAGQMGAAKFYATIRADNCNREVIVGLRRMSQLQLPYAKAPPHTVQLTRCSLHLKSFLNYRIRLNITSIYLAGNSCAAGDVISFYNSPLETVSFRQVCAPKNQSGGTNYGVVSMRNELFISYTRNNYYEESRAIRSGKLDVGIKFDVIATYETNFKVIDGNVNPRGVISYYVPADNTEFYHNYEWLLLGSIGSQFKLHFVRFNMGHMIANVSGLSCRKQLYVSYNSLRSYSTYDVYNEVPLGCTTDTPADITTPLHLARLILSATDLAPREGFQIYYTTVTSNETCSAYLDSPRSSLISSHFGNLNYTGAIVCAWEIELQVNQSATILIDTFDIEGACLKKALAIAGVSKERDAFRMTTYPCITKETAPQTKGVKYILPVFWKVSNPVNPSVLLSFNRTETGKSKGFSGELFIQNCGGHFVNAFEKDFTSPNYPNDYRTDIFCNYYFELIERRGVDIGYRLTFIEFDIGKNCEEDYFLITKPNFRPPLREKICRRDGLPKPIFVKGDIFLTFVSSRNLSLTQTPSTREISGSRKFKFRLEQATHGCGGTLLDPIGSFHSPNYTSPEDTTADARYKSYPNSIQCKWTIIAVPDFHLEFTFKTRFDLEASANCTNDFLLFEERFIDFVDDREVERWRVLKRLCGHETPAKINSTTNLVRVTFRTNDRVAGDGFKVNYKQVCGGLFQEESGTITSPHYSEGFYGDSVRCVFTIQRSPHEYIRIRFEDFALERPSNGECRFDVVRIILGDANNNSAPTYGPYCGTTLPPVLVSREKISVVFDTDTTISLRGFRFQYAVTQCGGNITNSSHGIISSPELSESSGNSGIFYCKWLITVPEEGGNSVAVRILQLDVFSQAFCVASLKIYSGDSNVRFNPSRNLLAAICTNNTSGDHQTSELIFKSTRNVLSIVYQKYEGYESSYINFKLEYYSTPGPKAGCGGSLRATSTGQVVSSPDVDGDSYADPGLNCLWSITSDSPSSSSVVQLEFERFDLNDEDSSGKVDSCSGGNFLAVLDGSKTNSPLLAKLCGRARLPDMLQSSGASLLLHFVTSADNSSTGQQHGFRVRYTTANRTCGGRLYPRAEKQEITSADYPQSVTALQQCLWQIERENFYPTEPIVLLFTDLDLNCSRGDYLQLQEVVTGSGGDQNSRALFQPLTLCTSPSQVKVVSVFEMNLLLRTYTEVHSPNFNFDIAPALRNQSAGRAQYRGFRMTYYTMWCGETLSGADNGYAFNRNYPRHNFANQNWTCVYNISVPEQQQIALHFTALSFGQCQYLNLTVYENNSTTAKATFCNIKKPSFPLFSTSNHLSVVIRTSSLPTTMDYQAHLKNSQFLFAFNYYSSPAGSPPGCGNPSNLTGHSGVFSSPLYPQTRLEPLDRVCSWLIHSNGYHTLTLTFSFFQLSDDCNQNRVVVYDAEEAIDAKKRATFCSMDKPAPIRSESSALFVQYVVSKNSYNGGFLASFKINLNSQNNLRLVISETSSYLRYTDPKTNTFTFL